MNENELYASLKDLNQAMGEAGGIAFCELWGVSTDEDGVKHHVRINVTARDLTSISALRQLMETIKLAKSEYNLKPYQPGFGNVSTPKAKPAEVNPSTNRPVKQVENANTFHCQKIVVSQYNGKAKIDLFATGRKYAELTTYMEAERAASWFGMDVEDFTGTGEYPVSMMVSWAPSEKLNSKGNPYKNIIKVEAA